MNQNLFVSIITKTKIKPINQLIKELYYAEFVSLALSEFKSRPKFDEGIFESYVHLNLVVPALFC